MRNVPLKLKENFYLTVVRYIIFYGKKYWTLKNQHENKVNVADMRKLCWMCGKTRYDKIKNENIRKICDVL